MKKHILFVIALLVGNFVQAKNEAESRFNHHGFDSYVKTLDDTQTTEEFMPNWSFLGTSITKEEKIAVTSDLERASFLIDNLNAQGKISAPSSVIDNFFIDKMDVIVGQGGKSLLDCVKSEHMTTAGIAHLIELLTSPTVDISLLKKRQNLIAYLVKNEKLCTDIEKIAQIIKENEKYSLALVSKDAQAGTLSTYINQRYNFPGFAKLNKLNKYSCALSIKHVHGDLIAGVGLGVVSCLGIAQALLLPSIQKKLEIDVGLARQISFSFAASGAGLLGYGGASIVEKVAKTVVEPQGPYRYICRVAQELASCMNNLKNSGTCIQVHKNIFDGICDVQTLNDLALNVGSDAFKRVIALAQDKGIQGGSAPRFFGKGGSIAFINNVMAAKNEIASALYAFGQLEAYVAIANLYRAHHNKNAQFCFVDFVESDKPVITMDDFWNPFISADTVVCNSIKIGDDVPGNIVVTGPNTGGKTTILKALAYNVLLAQVFGITAARTCRLKPVKKLACQLGVTDDLAHGMSLFQAEVNHAKALSIMVRALKPDEYAFIIMDEAFRGTNATEGEKISCKFVQQLAENKNCLTVTATHYPKMGELDGFGQKKVEVILYEDGSYTRTFKIKDGASHVNIAEQILKESDIFNS